jgi:hypothetical protein
MTITMADFDTVSWPWPEEGKPWDGLPMARLGLRAALFFDDGYGPRLRAALMTIIEQYVAFSGGRIRAYQRSGDRRRMAADASSPVDLEPLRSKVDKMGSPFSIEMSAEADPAVASHWSMVTVANNAGYLLLHLPLSVFEGAPPHSFRNLFQKWCSELNVLHAYAGLGLVLPVGGRALGGALRRSGPILTRFVGLDADDPGSTAMWCRTGIRTVNWLTAINADLLAKVGGEATVLRVAGEQVQAMPYTGGSIFVAGASAQLGDMQADNFPAAFRLLGRAVASLRADIPNAWLDAPSGYAAPPGFTSKSGWGDAEPEELPSLHYTKAWMARFDGG